MAVFILLQVPHVAFMPSHLLSTFSLGRQTALVVDIGWLETTVLPVSYSYWMAVYAGKTDSFTSVHPISTGIKAE